MSQPGRDSQFDRSCDSRICVVRSSVFELSQSILSRGLASVLSHVLSM